MQPRPTFPVAVLPTVGCNVHILLILTMFTMRTRSKNRVEKLEKVCRLTIKGVWSVWLWRWLAPVKWIRCFEVIARIIQVPPTIGPRGKDFPTHLEACVWEESCKLPRMYRAMGVRHSETMEAEVQHGFPSHTTDTPVLFKWCRRCRPLEDKVYGVMVAFTQISNEGFRVKATCETFRVLVRSSRVIGEE